MADFLSMPTTGNPGQPHPGTGQAPLGQPVGPSPQIPIPPTYPRNRSDPQVHAFLDKALKRWGLAEMAERPWREKCLFDAKFSIGEQWPAEIKADREQERTPMLTINRQPTFIRMITSEVRQQRPGIIVNPVGGGADVDTAEILTGAIRHIEVNSDAGLAYDHASDWQVRAGFGYFRITTKFLDRKKNLQEICLKRVKNPFSVYFQPNLAEPDYSDARWAFVCEDVPTVDFEDQHSTAEAATMTDFDSIGNVAPGG